MCEKSKYGVKENLEQKKKKKKLGTGDRQETGVMHPCLVFLAAVMGRVRASSTDRVSIHFSQTCSARVDQTKDPGDAAMKITWSRALQVPTIILVAHVQDGREEIGNSSC
jgi:hypothetical protein